MARRMLMAIACLILNGCALTLFPVVSNDAAKASAPGSNCSPNEVAKLRPGSEILVVYKSSAHTATDLKGTVIQAGPEGVAMMNCVRIQQTASVPSNRLFKVSGVGRSRVPVVWVPIDEMASLQVMHTPPADFVAPDFGINMDDSTYFERVGSDIDTRPAEPQ